ncbi:MAG TPA: NYN domain-containing protein [Candidatus Limnocylindria bacterium]
MSKNVAVFVDVANLYYAARGQDVDVDYVALLKHATKGRDLIRAYAYSGLDPENENQKKFLDFLNKNGYRVVAKDIRKFGDGRVKANLDIELVVDLFRLADRMDVAVIVSGDGDFAPAIRALQDVGVRCEVISFKPNTSSDLFAVADEFVDVMKISAIGRQKDAKGVGAPEMPAKEVNPDVGFREASPSVAAAALAAIRSDGDEPARGRGRGRGTTRGRDTARSGRSRSRSTEETPAAAAAPTPATPAAHADDDAGSTDARRRRRRGGRGRGRRGRRGDGVETDVAATTSEPAEIGWEELDSIEELDGGMTAGSPVQDDIAFEEADAATLAELGLTAPASAPASDTADETEVAAAPKSRSRSTAKGTTTSSSRAKATTRKPTAKTDAKPAAKPRTSAAKAGADGTKAAKPASRSRSTKAKATADPAATEGGDQGIWQRFTSGRGKKPTTPESPSES